VQCGGDDKHSGRGILLVLQGELFEDEVVTGLREGGEGPGATKEGPDMAEALVGTANDIEDESAVSNRLTKSCEVLSHLLEPAIVVGDGEVVLDEVAKPRLKVNGASLSVAKEM
jgi:hypothetical protein